MHLKSSFLEIYWKFTEYEGGGKAFRSTNLTRAWRNHRGNRNRDKKQIKQLQSQTEYVGNKQGCWKLNKPDHRGISKLHLIQVIINQKQYVSKHLVKNLKLFCSWYSRLSLWEFKNIYIYIYINMHIYIYFPRAQRLGVLLCLTFETKTIQGFAVPASIKMIFQ